MKLLKAVFLLFILSIVLVSCDNKDPDPTISIADINISIDENPSAGQTVASLDPTATGGNPVFSITSQTPSGAFEINASTGQITVANASLFDFEVNPTMNMVATATIGDINDNATIAVSLNNLLETLTTQDETVGMDENPTNGDAVVTVSATTDLGTASFAIVNESVSGAFAIDASTGALTVADASIFDFETNPTLTATVNVSNSPLEQTSIITVNLNDIFEVSWTQVSASVAFGGVYDHQIVDFNGKMWSIGGIRGTDRINEVWSSADGITWTQVTPTGNIFTPRNAHQAVVFNNKIWVIGGFTDNGRTNEIWSSTDGSTWAQENTQGIFGIRADHAALVFDSKVWVIGGSDGTFKNEVWNSTDGINWTQVNTTGTIFSARQGHTVTSFNGNMVLIGGASLDGSQLSPHNDIWTSSDGISWSQITLSGSTFSARWIHSAEAYNDLLWVIGGEDTGGNRFNDVWTSPDGLSWTQHNSSPIFDVRDNMATFLFNSNLWVSGGSNNNGILTDLWRSN
ncbi:hypothetical protein [Roseivirga sp. E12]|uniref:Kelch repeat-containing protein n=1 Tax=Roseivirga sp. E12 TaxID=2819237 RepID=UPI001ABC31B0|nr:hypothetical protein [Roseivirga sp. E12]MBO3700596.1 hypothetical protein [Roseivirga sp. E12]